MSTLVDEIERVQGAGYSSAGDQPSEPSTANAMAADSKMVPEAAEVAVENDRSADSLLSTAPRWWVPTTRQRISTLLRAVAGRLAGGAA